MNNCCLLILILLFCSNGNGHCVSHDCDYHCNANQDCDRCRERDWDDTRDRDWDRERCRERDRDRDSRMVYPSYSGGSTCGCEDSENKSS